MEHTKKGRLGTTSQRYIILKRMIAGEQFTMRKAVLEGIGDIRRRVKDLEEFYGVVIEHEVIDGRYTKYYISPENLSQAQEILYEAEAQQAA